MQTTNGYISFSDLVIAYRKAKADLYYERDHAGLLEFARYEQDLIRNLESLLGIIQNTQVPWWGRPEIVNGYSFIPKSIKLSKVALGTNATAEELITVTSDPEPDWKVLEENGGTSVEASYRLIANVSVSFHVLGALWMMKCGVKYDGVLGASVYGSRLRLGRNGAESEEKRLAPSMNIWSIGSFQPYSPMFRAWRSKGLAAVRAALENGDRVAVVTADLQRFYHMTDPSFLVDDRFLKLAGISLSSDDIIFTTAMIFAITSWNDSVPQEYRQNRLGLPVGLPAARVMANCALVQFDQAIERDVIPNYYGRYVDDIFIVLRNPGHWASAEDVWSHITKSTNVVRPRSADPETKRGRGFVLRLEGHESSELVFSGEKQKVFLLAGSPGLRMVESISENITRRASEWRLLPDQPESSDDFMSDIVGIQANDGGEVDNLRKADEITVRRLTFAIQLRNLEAIAQDLSPDEWRDQRIKFFKLVCDHVMTLPIFFDYAPYLSRLVGLAVSVADWDSALQLIYKLRELFNRLALPANDQARPRLLCYQHLMRRCVEATAQAISPSTEDFVEDPICQEYLQQLLNNSNVDFAVGGRPFDWFVLQAKTLFGSDLGRVPFRQVILEKVDGSDLAMFSQSAPLIDVRTTWGTALRANTIVAFLKSCDRPIQDVGFGDDRVPSPYLFPTRPFTISEVTLCDQGLLRDALRLSEYMLAIRGISCRDGIRSPSDEMDDGGKPISGFQSVYINHKNPRASRNIAIPCFLTKDHSWTASVSGQPDPDRAGRYFRINRLLNDIINRPRHAEHEITKPDYIVFPELSLPRRWFRRIAYRLQHDGISLIGGIEYLHHDPIRAGKSHAASVVSNQACASLVADFSGFSNAVTLVQEKCRASQSEESNLWNVAKVVLQYRTSDNKYIISHGDFTFGILICSELTNILFRQAYRGKVDALIVPEWNRDTETFNSLVESSALDVHCYLIQVNNREYGDCRIRAPFQRSYLRDVARVKGGENDYYVVGNIDIHLLRQFQSSYRSPPEPFKPVPDGFEISPRRRTLPLDPPS